MLNKTYERRRTLGLCPICGKEREDDRYIYCGKCREKEKIKSRENRAFYRNLHFCPVCRKNKLFGSEKTCPECVANSMIASAKSRDKLGKTKKDYDIEWQRKLKEQGICRTGCGRKRTEGHTYCEVCLARQRERLKEKLNRVGIQRSERPSYGLCYTCGEPLDREGNICSKCAEKMTKNLPKIRYNEVWKKDNKRIFKKS